VVESPYPAWAVLAGTVVIIGIVVLSLVTYPHNLDDRSAPGYLAVLGLLLALYIGLAVWAIVRPRPGRVIGAICGVVAAMMWMVEIWAGGPAMVSRSTEVALGSTFLLLAVAVTLTAGPLAAGLTARRVDRRLVPAIALRAGLFAGLVSGVLVFVAAVALTLSTLDTLARRTDYQQQFVHSGAPDMHTYLVGDILAAVTAHLVINLVLGLIGGGIGALVASARGRAAISQA
jgi:hypothetical protein